MVAAGRGIYGWKEGISQRICRYKFRKVGPTPRRRALAA